LVILRESIMEFDVVVGLSGVFLLLLSLGLTCFSEVAREGGLILGLISSILGGVLIYSAIYLL